MWIGGLTTVVFSVLPVPDVISSSLASSPIISSSNAALKPFFLDAILTAYTQCTLTTVRLSLSYHLLSQG